MSAVTMTARTVSPRVRVRKAVDTLRWAKAPYWEGDAAHKAGFVAYVAVSVVAWTVLGLAVAAGLGALLPG
ncbi:hypothetical protein [Cellulomonas massiliensis]|uniref:hypothetical protein n=1 Tax=Cellulomonas massiliensis TaxID=1465811 RepID=UPI0002D4A42A|nr:hypothetical protein [Cellulomonas massiliensis]